MTYIYFFRYREIDKVSPQPLFRHYQCTSQLIWIIHKTLTALISTARVLFWSLSMPLAFRDLTNMEGPNVGITDAVFVSYHIRIMPTVIMMSLQWSKAILASLLKQKGSLSSRNKVQLFFKKTKCVGWEVSTAALDSPVKKKSLCFGKPGWSPSDLLHFLTCSLL